MKRKIWLVVTLVTGLLVLLVGTMGGAAAKSIAPSLAKANPARLAAADDRGAGEVSNQQNRPVANFLAAFDALTINGEWLGFHPGDAPYADEICLCTEYEGIPVPVDLCMPTCDLDEYISCCPTRQQHYQGIARAPVVGGPPIFFVARAGKPDASLDPTEGAIWVVEMGSRDHDGERLRSNRLQKDIETQYTMPGSEDKVIHYWEFRSNYETPGGQFIDLDYHHPGGIQLVGDVLAVSLENANKDGMDLGKVAFFDVSTPTSPRFLGDFGLSFKDHGVAAVGIIRLPDDHFLAVVFTGGGDDRMKFFRSNGTDFNDAGFYFCEKEEGRCEDEDTHTIFSTGDLNDLADLGYWRWKPEPQSLNFVNETGNDDSVWLIGAVNDKETAPVQNGADILYVWEVAGFAEGEAVTMTGTRKNVSKQLSSEGNMSSDDPVCDWIWPNNLRRQEANFSAGAGAYVSPSGELLYYATSYWNLGEGFINRMAELRHSDVSSSSTCGPQFRDNHLGGPYFIPEGSQLTLYGNVHVIEPWAQMYAYAGYTGPSYMLDWRDQSLEDWQDFRLLDGHREWFLIPPAWGDACRNKTGIVDERGTNGFDNCMESFRFCGPVNAKLEIYDDNANDGWEGADGNNGWISCEGTGSVVYAGSFIDPANYPQPASCKQEAAGKSWAEYENQASSARIVWTRPEQTYAWQKAGSGTLVPINDGRSADFTAGRGSATTKVDLTVWGQTVSTVIDVYNVPPAFASFLIEPGAAAEGQIVDMTVEWLDPGAPSVNWEVDWGDGSTPDSGSSASAQDGGPFSAAFSAAHVYADNGRYDITVTLDDTDQDGRSRMTKGITIDNVAPHDVDAGLDQLVYEGDWLKLDPAIFSDRGTLDTHTATVDWGDGSPQEAAAVTESPFGPPGSTAGADGTVDASHQYLAAPGRYTVEVCVRDDELAETCDTLHVTVVHGFMRFCAYADDVQQGLTVHKDVRAACSLSPSGIPGEMRQSGIGSRGDLAIKDQVTFEGSLLSLNGKIHAGKNVIVSGPLTAGHDVRIYEGAQINNSITSGHRVEIKKDAVVNGDVIAAGWIKVDRRATVNGLKSAYTPVPPIPAISWLDFEVEAGTENVTLRRGAVWTLEAGAYRDLKVGSGATLTLKAGQFTFRRITMEKGAVLRFDSVGRSGHDCDRRGGKTAVETECADGDHAGRRRAADGHGRGYPLPPGEFSTRQGQEAFPGDHRADAGRRALSRHIPRSLQQRAVGGWGAVGRGAVRP